jgi:hypothetical protein
VNDAFLSGDTLTLALSHNRPLHSTYSQSYLFLPPQKFEVGEDERKKPLGRPTHTQDDDIKWMLKGIGWEHVD